MSEREEIWEHKKRGVWVGRFHDEDPRPNKYIARNLAKISELEHLSVKRRRRVLRELWIQKREEILQEQKNKPITMSKSVLSCMQDWLDSLRSKKKKLRTLSEYATSLNYYLSAVGNHDINAWDNKFEVLFTDYLYHPDRKRKDPITGKLRPKKACDDVTVAKHIGHVNQFFGWAKRKVEGFDKEIKMDEPETTEKPIIPYTKSQLDILETEVRKRKHKNALRVITMMKETAMRPGEVWAMKLNWLVTDEDGDLWIHVQDDPENINEYGDAFRVKGRHEGLVPVSDTLLEFIKNDTRSENEIWYLDNGHGSHHWTRHDSFSRYFARLCSKFGYKGQKPLHAIRSYVITELLGMDESWDTVRDVARHTKFDTSLLYRFDPQIKHKKKRAVNQLAKIK